MERSIIQADLKIKGAVLTDSAVEVHGKVDGDVIGRLVEIGLGGACEGDIVAETAIVAGRVRGRVTARTVRLLASSKIMGDLIHQQLAIEQGAEFEGTVMRKTDEAAWQEITATFYTPGHELTDEASDAVDALAAEAARSGG